MRPLSSPLLESDFTVEQALRRVESHSADIYLVRMTPSGWSAIGREELKKRLGEGKGEHSLRSVLTYKELPPLYPDLPLDMALRHVQEAPLIPVVNRADSQKLEGVLTADSVLERYQSGTQE